MPLLLATNMHHKTRVMVHLVALASLPVHEIARIRERTSISSGATINVIGKGGVKAAVPMHEVLLELAQARCLGTAWWFPPEGVTTPPHSTKIGGYALGTSMERAGVPGSAHSLRYWFSTNLV